MGECLYMNFNEFLCIYLGEGRECTNACNICMGTHSQTFLYRTDWWIFTKLGREEVSMVPYKCCCFSARSVPGRGKNRPWGPLLQRTSSSDQKATATNRMHSNNLEACGKNFCYLLFHSEVKFLMRFWRLFGLSHFAFLCIFYRFLCG